MMSIESLDKKPSRLLNVLVACEESQAECSAFRALGHNAYSCDIQPCRKAGNPHWHIQGDVTQYLDGKTDFVTQAGDYVQLTKWDLIIAHPPCTYLCKMGSLWLYAEPLELVKTFDGWERVNVFRWHKLMKAREFFFKCLDAKAPFVAVENPIPMRKANLPRPSAYACPSWFGVKYTKKTLYWLKNLPPIFAEIDFPNPKSFVRSSRGKYRSRTFPQLAKALARQWADYILREYASLDNRTEF